MKAVSIVCTLINIALTTTSVISAISAKSERRKAEDIDTRAVEREINRRKAENEIIMQRMRFGTENIRP